MPADPRRVKDLFVAALDLPDSAARAALLDRECASDPDLRHRVDVLLAAHEQPESALERPLGVEAPTGAYEPRVESVGTMIASKYKLLELIGEGGMGEVWVADQLEPIRRRVALKVIKAGMDSKSVLARFEAERQALALMDHPNIARVLDAGATADGRPFFVMELVKGTPITEFCDARKLTPRERLELFVPVCQAVQHAHQKGIIHRDIKPSNVLVALHDEHPVPKVIDFGVAKAVGQQLTEKTLYTGFGALIGTPAYMAPEQATFNQLDVDTRADVYSLGVLLYELLAGSPPFEAARLKQVALDEVLRLLREEEPPRPSHRLSTSKARATIATVRQSDPEKLTRLVRGELDWIVMKALEKDRTRRYETANGLAADVQRYLAGEAVQAVPPSPGYRLRKFARKNRPVLVGAAAFAFLLAAGTGVSAWQAVRATTAERQARADRAAAEEQRQLAEQREAQAKENEQKARTAEAAAKESDATAQAVLKFVGSEVFAAPNPRFQETPGRDVTLRQALDAAEPKISTAFAGRPRVEAMLRTTLGYTYADLGELRPAVTQLERALALAQAHFPDDPLTRNIEISLSRRYFELGRKEEATQLLERSLARQRKALGPDHHDTVFTLAELIGQFRNSGRSADVRRLAQDLLRLQLDRAVTDDAEPMDLVNLSLAYGAAGRADEGLRLLEQGLPRYREKRGPDDCHVLDITRLIAGVYWRAGRRADSIRLLEPAYRQAVGKYGQTAGFTHQLLWDLSSRLVQVGRYADAARLLEEALPELRKRYGPANSVISPHVINLSEAYSKLGRRRDAARLLEATIADIPEAERTAYTNYDFLLGNLADAFQKLGEVAKARRVTAEEEAWIRRRCTADSLDLAGHLAKLGLGRIDIRLFEDAERVLRESLAIRVAMAPDDYRRFNSAALLGAALLGQEKYAEAEPLLVTGYDGLKARQKDIPPEGQEYIPRAGRALARLYERTGRQEKAEAIRAELPPEELPYPRVVGP
ncbi:MAG TPA: protein kinase [Gemmataceae bacterium]|nr:protein kinase [Gemmataceae bacterium]